jgi:Domain of unknown function (DUF5666)
VGLASAVATAFVLAGSYGIAAAAPSLFHGHGRHFSRVLYGTVTSVGTGSFTLEVGHDHALTVLTTSATKYRESGSPDPVSGVAIGEHVVVLLAPRHHATAPVSPTTTATTSTTVQPSATTSTSLQPSATRLTAANTTPPPLTAEAVEIILARESGQVSDLSASTITLGSRLGHTRTVEISASTTFFEGGKTVTQSALAKGDFITAYGNPTGGVLDALNVDIYPVHPKTTAKDADALKRSSTNKDDHVGTFGSPTVNHSMPTEPSKTTAAQTSKQAGVAGVVQSVSGDTILVRSFTGAMETVTVTSSTVYRDQGGPAGLSAVAKGDPVRVYGTAGPTGALTALLVVISGQPMSAPAGWSHAQPESPQRQPVSGRAPATWTASHPSTGSTRTRHH